MVSESFAFSGLSLQDSEPRSAILPLPKTKVKTKATTTIQDAEVDQATPEAESEGTPLAPVFELKTRELRVFTALFYQPSLKDTPSGEIPMGRLSCGHESHRL